MRHLAVAALAAIACLGAHAQVVPEGCEVHNSDSLLGEVDLPQEAIDLFCGNDMSARTYASARAIDVGLPNEASALLRARDPSAINLAKGIVVMFLGYLRKTHGYKGTFVEVELFAGRHVHYSDKTPIATATTKLQGLASTTPEFHIEFHQSPTPSALAETAPQPQAGTWASLDVEGKLERLRGEVFALKTLTGLSLAFNAIGSDRIDAAWVVREIEDMEQHGPSVERHSDAFEGGRSRVYRGIVSALGGIDEE